MKRILIVICILISGCASIDKVMTGSSAVPSDNERQKIVEQFSDLTPSQKEKFVHGEPWIGMTQEQLKAMWNNGPKKTQKKLTSRGNEEIQIYELRVGSVATGIRSKYYKVSMLDGKVAELQELDSSVGSLDKL